MKLSDVVTTLQTYLPKFTDYFSDKVSISSLTRAGSTVTAVTSADHGFSTDDYIHISGAQAPLLLSSLVYVGTLSIASITRVARTVTVTTSSPHNLFTGITLEIVGADQQDYNGEHLIRVTSATKFTYLILTNPVTPATTTGALTAEVNLAIGETVNNHAMRSTYSNFDLSEKEAQFYITGADQAGYNGLQTAVNILNRKQVTFSLSSEPVTPATGTIYLMDNFERGYNGLHQITVTDTDKFTYAISETPETPAQTISTIYAKNNLRISAAVSQQRVLESYSRQSTDKYWLFATMGTSTISKDRKIENDATTTLMPGQSFRLLSIQSLSIYVVAPSSSSLSASAVSDSMIDVEVAIYKSLLGKHFTSPFASDDKFYLTPVSNQNAYYDTSVYIHEYSFETVGYITYYDTLLPTIDIVVPFLRIDGDYNNNVLSTNINLDDNPV